MLAFVCAPSSTSPTHHTTCDAESPRSHPTFPLGMAFVSRQASLSRHNARASPHPNCSGEVLATMHRQTHVLLSSCPLLLKLAAKRMISGRDREKAIRVQRMRGLLPCHLFEASWTSPPQPKGAATPNLPTKSIRTKIVDSNFPGNPLWT